MNAAVQEAVHQFFASVDRHDWKRLRDCLRDEVAVDDGRRIPADEYVATREERFDGVRTNHLCSNHAIKVEGEHAECAVSALILRTDARGRTRDTISEITCGLTRAGHRWRIDRIGERVIWSRGHADVPVS